MAKITEQEVLSKLRDQGITNLDSLAELATVKGQELDVTVSDADWIVHKGYVFAHT